jgi:hypothetical protein
MAETAAGTEFTRSLMAMHPLHRMRRRKRQRAGQHLVECDAERIEVAAEINRAVHPPGLFGRHVRERANDELGRRGRASLADQARGDTEPGEPDLFVLAIHQDMRRLHVLVDEAALMDLAQSSSDADRELQEASNLYGRA